MGKPTPEQLAKINQLALVPLTEDQAHVFEAKIIGTKVIDKYKTRITPNFLQKMADQVKTGIALLVDHPWAKWEALAFPYGRTFDSRIIQNGPDLELYGDHYMRSGQDIDGISTDQLAAGIDAGTIFDTSAGWVTTKEICNICNGPYYGNPDCNHLKGRIYDGVECITNSDDGYIMENSVVFDGAYEGAGFTQQRSLSKANREKPEKPIEFEALPLDAKSLPGDGSVYYFASKNRGVSAFIPKQQKNDEAKKLAEGDENVDNKEQAVQLQQAQTALTHATGLLGQIRAALGVETDSGILGKIASMSSQAEDGETYKTKVTEEACGAGIRALGEAFNVEAMKLSLSNLPVSEIEKIRDSYEAQAKVVLGGGGRHTQGADTDFPAGAAAGAAPSNPQANGGQETPEQLQAKAREEARAALKNTGHAHLIKEGK